MIFPVGTGDGSRHGFGGIPLSCTHDLGDALVHDQGIEVVHEYMAAVVRLDPVVVDLRATSASGSMLERCVLLLSLMPRKSSMAGFLPVFGAPKPSPGTDGGRGGSSSPSFRCSDVWDAKACSEEPSTEKCISRMRSGVGAQHRANTAPCARHQPRNEPAVVDSRLRDPAIVTASLRHGDGQSRPAPGTSRHRGPVA